MRQKNETGAVVVAAGTGSRMGGGTPKQFRLWQGKPLYRHSVDAFLRSGACGEVVLVTGKDHLDRCREELSGTGVIVAGGGATRAESVAAGLSALSGDVRYVLVHDGARPFVTEDLILRVKEETLKTGAAVPAVPPKDTVRTKERTLERERLHLVQTPQGFRKDILALALETAFETGFSGTDDASYVEMTGVRISLVPGDPGNIKITTPEDMPMEERVGTGFDVHRFGDPEDTELIIGGCRIPYTRPLLAHSDGDVLAHAVTDALLGAAGIGDIGELFPDTDEKYEGADSLLLLKEAGERLAERGFIPVNIDATLIGQEPKFSPYKKQMAENLAGALGMDPGGVCVKATTTERLGFTGRGEGLAAQAVCLIRNQQR